MLVCNVLYPQTRMEYIGYIYIINEILYCKRFERQILM